MKIEAALAEKKKELESMQSDINSLTGRAADLKDGVKEYNDLMKKASDLKKLKKQKEREFNTVISFFSTTDENYLTKMFPLFQGTGSDGLIFKGPAAEGEFPKAQEAGVFAIEGKEVKNG